MRYILNYLKELSNKYKQRFKIWLDNKMYRIWFVTFTIKLKTLKNKILIAYFNFLIKLKDRVTRIIKFIVRWLLVMIAIYFFPFCINFLYMYILGHVLLFIYRQRKIYNEEWLRQTNLRKILNERKIDNYKKWYDHKHRNDHKKK